MNAIIRSGAIAVVALLGLQAYAAPITTTIRLQERVSMEQLASNVYNPNSDHYGRFYEPAEIRQLSAPSDADYGKLLSDLKDEGFTIVSESPTHLWITIRGEQAIYESIFNTQIQKTTTGQRKQMKAVSMPFQYKLIASVAGLDNTRQAHPHFVMRQSQPQNPPQMGISQAAIKTGYGFDPIYAAGINGTGVDIAIATYDGFTVKNVQSFYSQSNLSPLPTADEVTYNGTPNYDPNSAMETELDAEFSGMIAPGASVHVFASATNDDAGEVQMFTAILDDNRAKVANYSWGSCEPQVTQQHAQDMDKIFARAVAQGVNITVASGDSGSDSCQDGTNKADWPSAHPNVVSVGGTTFLQSGGKLAEQGWNEGGGGISALWSSPTYQNGLAAPYNAMRSYPDVSFNADPNTGQAIYSGQPNRPQWLVIGGTSMAAPQWAGFLALVGSARKAAGKADLGFMNPAIYGMDAATRAATFHDVTKGNNGLYSAGPGWDAVTGWGSMQADALLNYFKTL